MADFYISHTIKPVNGESYLNGELVPFAIQIISSLVNPRKTISFIFGGSKQLINVENNKQLKKQLKKILKDFVFFQLEILKFDKHYNSEFTMFVLECFLNNERFTGKSKPI